jgi:hypothetical protein
MTKLRVAVVGVGHLGQHRGPRSTIPRSGEREGAPEWGA